MEEDFFSNKTNVNLQQAFSTFRKNKALEHKNNVLLKGPKPDPETLRQKFVQRAQDYIGVPYAQKYHEPGTEAYNSPLFLDCCALVRKVLDDLKDDFGFITGRWNQAYQFDTLPISFETDDQLKPGDLVFVEGIYYDKKKRQQVHNITHVEISLGGEKTLGAR